MNSFANVYASLISPPKRRPNETITTKPGVRSDSRSEKAFKDVTTATQPARANLSRFDTQQIRLAFYEAVAQGNKEAWADRLWQEITDRRNRNDAAGAENLPLEDGFLIRLPKNEVKLISFVTSAAGQRAGDAFLEHLSKFNSEMLTHLANKPKLVAFLNAAYELAQVRRGQSDGVAGYLLGKAPLKSLPRELQAWGDVLHDDPQAQHTKALLHTLLRPRPFIPDASDKASSKVQLLAQTLTQLRQHEEPKHVRRQLQALMNHDFKANGNLHRNMPFYLNEMRCAEALIDSGLDDVIHFPLDKSSARPPLVWPSVSKIPLLHKYRLHQTLPKVAQGEKQTFKACEMPDLFKARQDAINWDWPLEHDAPQIKKDMKRAHGYHEDVEGNKQSWTSIDRQNLPKELLNLMCQHRLPRHAEHMARDLLGFNKEVVGLHYRIDAKRLAEDCYAIDFKAIPSHSEDAQWHAQPQGSQYPFLPCTLDMAYEMRKVGNDWQPPQIISASLGPTSLHDIDNIDAMHGDGDMSVDSDLRDDGDMSGIDEEGAADRVAITPRASTLPRASKVDDSDDEGLAAQIAMSRRVSTISRLSKHGQ